MMPWVLAPQRDQRVAPGLPAYKLAWSIELPQGSVDLIKAHVDLARAGG